MHVSADEAREDDLSLSPHLLLLALPFDAADRIFALRWRRRLSRALEFLCALAGDLKDAVTRHRLMHQNVKFNCSVNECCSKRPVYTAKFQRGYGRSRFALTGVQNPLTTSLFRPNSDRNPPGVKRNKPGI